MAQAKPFAKNGRAPSKGSAPGKVAGRGPATAKPQGLIQQMAAVMQGVDRTVLDAAVAATDAASGRRYEPPDGRYIFEIIEGSTAELREPKDRGPYPLYNLALKIAGTDPGLEAAMDREFLHPFFMFVRRDRNGNDVCFAAAELKAIGKLLFGDDAPEASDELFVAIAGEVGTQFDVVVKTKTRTDNEGNEKSFTNYYWNQVIQQ